MLQVAGKVAHPEMQGMPVKMGVEEVVAPVERQVRLFH